jgi:hypothetical protein
MSVRIQVGWADLIVLIQSSFSGPFTLYARDLYPPGLFPKGLFP